ncbi:MAG: enoyl-CoA hydratase/isomerase family protein, partial [Gammaproteobacteria bacterium]|nr:enoyl-CoA hydratase/isomerase family protein [Gammaproteobacteria bacterium]NIR94116.1 enoyl-CoA hydratase/isomerase family protein [Gammaproteobacteria bacterium]
QETILQFIEELENLLLRLAILDLPTVVAINGNCYAGGALIASACDFRYMRADRGRFCFPEVKIEKAFTPVMIEV